MLPVLALVGRPNVGKSTLFNALTGTRDALVADTPGLTRDRQYGRARSGRHAYLVMDSGGLSGEQQGIDSAMAQQVWRGLEEARAVLFLVDARAGLTAQDQNIAERLRRIDKPLFLVVNKTEHLEPNTACAEFHALGLGTPLAISASHRRGLERLLDTIFSELPGLAEETPDVAVQDTAIRLALVGRPNTGKSTLINRLLGEERMLTYDSPGTTRDSIEVPFHHQGQDYVLIDTAGVRRRSRVNEAIEKFSVIKTLQAIEQSHVVIMLIDARQGLGEQDKTLLGHVLDSGRALVLAVNKWDGLEPEQRQQVRRELDRRLAFIDFADIHFISALHGSGIRAVLSSVERAYRAATRKLNTAELTRILEDAVHSHPPPAVQGRGVKLRYAHQGGHNPPLIVIHGNRVECLSDSYKRYLANVYRQNLNLHGTPVRIVCKSGVNPYQPSDRKSKTRRN